MNPRTFAALCCVLCLLAAPAHAQDRTHDITPDDYFTLAAITEIALSPDGKQVAFGLGTWDKADDSRKGDLWVVATDGKGKPTRLTFDRASDRHLRWSADGKSIYFLGNRKQGTDAKAPYDGKTQVWRINANGGEPKAMTREAGGVASFDYAPQVDALFLQLDSTETDDDTFAKLRAKFGKLDYGHGKRKVSEIHKLDLTTWRMDKLVADKRYIREFAVTRDGKRIAMISAYDDSVVRSEGESRVDIWEGGKIVTPPTDVYRKNAATPHAWLENLAWAPDGNCFAFCAIFDAHPADIVIGTQAGGSWETAYAKRLKSSHVYGYGSPIKFIAQDTLVCVHEASGGAGLVEANVRDAHAHQNIPVAKGRCSTVFDVTLDKAGNAEYVIVEASSGGFPILKSLNNEKLLFDPNPHTKTWKLPTVQHFTWSGPNGFVGGVLELPFGHKKGDKLPLVVAIHGGPTTSTKAEQSFDPHNGRLYFAAKGYAVLCPNYRGSTGYGDKFVTDLIGQENDIEVKDILAGIQHLVNGSIADPNRVAVTGWSNGGYLTNCLITLKDPPFQFKAASSGASILDNVLEWGTNDEPAYPMVFKKGLPWKMPDIYHKTSPTYGLGNVTTPTLIHVGANDERCPPGHSKMLYRALKEYQKVPTELIVYPGEPHGLTKMSHRKAKMEWDLAWFEKYIKGGK